MQVGNVGAHRESRGQSGCCQTKDQEEETRCRQQGEGVNPGRQTHSGTHMKSGPTSTSGPAESEDIITGTSPTTPGLPMTAACTVGLRIMSEDMFELRNRKRQTSTSWESLIVRLQCIILIKLPLTLFHFWRMTLDVPPLKVGKLMSHRGRDNSIVNFTIQIHFTCHRPFLAYAEHIRHNVSMFWCNKS